MPSFKKSLIVKQFQGNYLKVFFRGKEDNSNTSYKDTFEALQTRKSKWTPPESQRASSPLKRLFINKCRYDINKLNFNRNTKFSTLSSEERAALENLRRFACLAGRPLPKRSFLTPLLMLKSIKISLPMTNKLSRAL